VESKPPKTSWLVEEKVRQKIEALQAYAVDACDDEQRRLAGNVIHQITLSFFFTILIIVFKYSICLQYDSLLNVQK
jgi:hypothetical protein